MHSNQHSQNTMYLHKTTFNHPMSDTLSDNCSTTINTTNTQIRQNPQMRQHDIIDPLMERFDIIPEYNAEKDNQFNIKFQNMIHNKQNTVKKSSNSIQFPDGNPYETKGHTYLIQVGDTYRLFWNNVLESELLSNIFKETYSLFEDDSNINVRYIGNTRRIDVPKVMDKDGFIHFSQFDGTIDEFVEKYKEYQKLFPYFNDMNSSTSTGQDDQESEEEQYNRIKECFGRHIVNSEWKNKQVFDQINYENNKHKNKQYKRFNEVKKLLEPYFKDGLSEESKNKHVIRFICNEESEEKLKTIYDNNCQKKKLEKELEKELEEELDPIVDRFQIGISTRNIGNPSGKLTGKYPENDLRILCQDDIWPPFSKKYSFIQTNDPNTQIHKDKHNQFHVLLNTSSKMVHFIENIDVVNDVRTSLNSYRHFVNQSTDTDTDTSQNHISKGHNLLFNTLQVYDCLFNERIRNYYFPDLEFSKEPFKIESSTLKNVIEQLEFQEFDTIEEFDEYLSKEHRFNVEEETVRYLKNTYEFISEPSCRKQYSDLLNEIKSKLELNETDIKELKKHLPKILLDLGYQKKRYSSGIFWYGFKSKKNAPTNISKGFDIFCNHNGHLDDIPSETILDKFPFETSNQPRQSMPYMNEKIFTLKELYHKR